MPTTTLKIAAAYIRVSTHDQEELSPDSQLRLIREYCKKNQISLSSNHIFLDGGISGRKAESRPEFQRMISLAKEKNHNFDVILVWKFSRFARNQEESIVYKTLLKKNQVDVVSISEPLLDGPFGSLIERIIEWMDEYYSIRLSSDVKRGMTENALRGFYQAPAPLGYKNHNKSLIPIPEEAEIVRFIFNKYTSKNMGILAIAQLLNKLNLTTKKGNPFENRTIRYILQNPVYIGYVRWNMEKSNSKATATPSDAILKNGDFEAIISKDIFEKAQEKLSRNLYKKIQRPAELKGHWLSSLIKCSSCGSSLTYTQAQKGFQCIHYTHGKCPFSHYISSNNLIQTIIDTFSTSISASLIYTITEPMISSDSDLELSMLYTSLEKTKEKEKRIKEAYRNGIDTLTEYQEHKNILAKELSSIQDSITLLSTIQKNPDIPNKKSISTVVDILRSDADKLEKSRAIHSICHKIVYNKSLKTIDIYCVYKN